MYTAKTGKFTCPYTYLNKYLEVARIRKTIFSDPSGMRDLKTLHPQESARNSQGKMRSYWSLVSQL